MSFLRAIAWLRANPVFLLVLALVVAYVSGRHSGVSAERARWENVIADKNRDIARYRTATRTLMAADDERRISEIDAAIRAADSIGDGCVIPPEVISRLNGIH